MVPVHALGQDWALVLHGYGPPILHSVHSVEMVRQPLRQLQSKEELPGTAEKEIWEEEH